MEIVKELFHVISLMKSMLIIDVNVFKDSNIIISEIVFQSKMSAELTNNLSMEIVYV